MNTLKPRRLKHQGHVHANGFLISWSPIGVLAARRRVLSLWQLGAQVRRLESAYLILWPRALHIDCSHAPGDPLVSIGRLLTALPLSPQEVEALCLPVDCVLMARGGKFQVTALEALPEEDVAGWFSLDAMNVAKVRSLGESPAAPVFVTAEFDARSEMGAPCSSAELQQFLQALQAQKSDQPIPVAKDRWYHQMAQALAGGSMALGTGIRELFRKPLAWFRQKQADDSMIAKAATPALASAGGRKKALSLGARLLLGVVGVGGVVAMLITMPVASLLPVAISAIALRSFLRRLVGKSSAAARPANPASASAAAKKPPSWLSQKMNHALMKMLMMTRLSRVMGARYARHIGRVIQMLEHGDVDEALRNAVPLNDMPNVSGRVSVFSGLFRALTPRKNLSISPYRNAPGNSLNFGNDFFQYMKALYRQTFQRLEAQGRIEEAAFVLSELLSANAEAVSFLEKHGRLRLAAELAEARNLPAPTVVRLWFLAKDTKRAVAVARRTGSFQTAIALLGRTHPEEARYLRMHWAGKLAEAGKYFAAATTIWEVESGRYLAARWFDQAIELGGSAGAAALAKRVARFPTTFQTCLPRITALLEDEQQERALERLAFVDALLPEPITPESRTLSRAATRSLVRDMQQGSIERTPAQLRRVVEYAGEGSLRADVPAVSKLVMEPESPVSVVLEIARHDVGRSHLYDCAVLPDGKLLLAMGEAGAVLCSRDGKPQVTFQQPIYKLVLSDEGSRAIGIAERGEVSRLCRIDLVMRKAVYWCDAPISVAASSFDGSLWYVAQKNDVYVIDALSPRFDALWRLPELGQRVKTLQRNDDGERLSIISIDAGKLTHWVYALPGHTLRSKQELVSSTELQALDRVVAIADNGGVVYEKLGVLYPDEKTKEMHMRSEMYLHVGNRVERASEAVQGGALHLAASRGKFIAIPVFDLEHDAVVIFVLDAKSGLGQVRIRLGGSRQIAMRFVENVLVCCDDLGRILAFDLVRNKIVHNQRF